MSECWNWFLFGNLFLGFCWSSQVFRLCIWWHSSSVLSKEFWFKPKLGDTIRDEIKFSFLHGDATVETNAFHTATYSTQVHVLSTWSMQKKKQTKKKHGFSMPTTPGSTQPNSPGFNCTTHNSWKDGTFSTPASLGNLQRSVCWSDPSSGTRWLPHANGCWPLSPLSTAFPHTSYHLLTRFHSEQTPRSPPPPPPPPPLFNVCPASLGSVGGGTGLDWTGLGG